MDSDILTRTNLRSIDVHLILPQQEPFVMVGSLVHIDELTSITETLIKPTNIFIKNGFFSPFGMMENIAQTCAVRIGFFNKFLYNKDVQIGFIGAIRKFIIYKLPPVGSIITTTVEIIEDVFGMILASAKIVSNDEILATTEIKLSVKTIE